MRLKALFETTWPISPGPFDRSEDSLVMRALHRYFLENGIPNEKMDYDRTPYMYVGGGPGNSPKKAYCMVKINAGNISIGYYGGRPHYLETTLNLHDPDSFPKAVAFLKARKDVIEPLHEDWKDDLHDEDIDTIREAMLAYLLENGVDVGEVRYRTIRTINPRYMITVTHRGVLVSPQEDGLASPDMVSYRVVDPESFPKVLKHVRS